MDTQTKRFAFAILLMQDQLIDLGLREKELATKIERANPPKPKYIQTIPPNMEWVKTLQQALDNVHAWQKELRDAVNVLEEAQ